MYEWQQRTMIVTDAVVEQVRSIASGFGAAAENMWTTPLSETGELPATHWISSGYVDAPFASFMPLTEIEESAEGTVIKTTPYDYGKFRAVCEAFQIETFPDEDTMNSVMAEVQVFPYAADVVLQHVGMKQAWSNPQPA